MDTIKAEIAATAARLVVEEGMEYGPAKRRAARDLRAPPRAGLPDNDALEDAVREYIAVFCADTQGAELFALRQTALVWMERLVEFRPHVGGAVWRGTATSRSDLHLQLFCDDSKSVEIALIDKHVAYEASEMTAFNGKTVSVLHFHADCEGLRETIGVHLSVMDYDDVRGALKADAQGRSQRGDAAALRRLMQEKEIEKEQKEGAHA